MEYTNKIINTCEMSHTEKGAYIKAYKELKLINDSYIKLTNKALLTHKIVNIYNRGLISINMRTVLFMEL